MDQKPGLKLCQLVRQGDTTIGYGQTPVLYGGMGLTVFLAETVCFLRSGCPSVQLISDTTSHNLANELAELRSELQKLQLSGETFRVEVVYSPEDSGPCNRVALVTRSS